MPRFFAIAKVPCFLDDIRHSLEDRKGTETKIITLVCRVQPFTSQLGIALDDVVRRILFAPNATPAPNLKAVEFTLPIPRQQLLVFMTPDTAKAGICLDQVKIAGLRARLEKSVGGWGFVFKASFGPASKTELEYVEHWRTQPRFVTFKEAEPSLEFEEEDEADDDEQEAPDTPRHRSPMFDDDGHALDAQGQKIPGGEAPHRATNGDGDEKAAGKPTPFKKPH